LVKPALRPTAQGGWWGKILYEACRAINIVLRRGEYLQRFGMTRPTIPGLRWLAFPFVLKK
jgi:hypothetical protein